MFFDMLEWIWKPIRGVSNQRDGNNGIAPSTDESNPYSGDMEVETQRANTEAMIQFNQKMKSVPAVSTYQGGNQGIPTSTGETSVYNNMEVESQKRISEELPNWGRSYEALPNSFNQQGASYYSKEDWEYLIENVQNEIESIQGKRPTREEASAYLRKHYIFPDVHSFPEGKWIGANDYPDQFDISEIPQQSVRIDEKYVKTPSVYDGVLGKDVVYRGVRTPEEIAAREERRRKALQASYVEALGGGFANVVSGTMQGAGRFAKDFTESQIQAVEQELRDRGYSEELSDSVGSLGREYGKVENYSLYNMGKQIGEKLDNNEYELIPGEEGKYLLYAMGKHGTGRLMGRVAPITSRVASLMQLREKVANSKTMSPEKINEELEKIDKKIRDESSYQPELY